MKAWEKREKDKERTLLVCFELLDAVINNIDYTHLVNELKTIDLNTFRIGRENKFKVLFHWVFPTNWDEEGIKNYNSKADYYYIYNTIKNICKKVVKNEI